MTAKQREAEMNARSIAERDARLAAMSIDELLHRMRDIESASAFGGYHYAANPTNHYRTELERRLDTLALELAA